MHKLVIHKLGPIEHCELECSQFMTLTGFQASGKSTIAKAIYYFRTIKEDILELAKAQALRTVSVVGLDTWQDAPYGADLKEQLENVLRAKFIRTFGFFCGTSDETFIQYHFTDTCYISISLTERINTITKSYICIT
ncbi:MAG: hypothetical protein K2L18_06975, partial [Acetatifactor sp.]|nr:hypothetical protein [Acetatifactor sp.]